MTPREDSGTGQRVWRGFQGAGPAATGPPGLPPAPAAPLARAPHTIQSQLSEVFKMVIYCDYPERWPGLMEALYGNLGAQVGA